MGAQVPISQSVPATWQLHSAIKTARRYFVPSVRSAAQELALAEAAGADLAARAWLQLLGHFQSAARNELARAVHALAELDCLLALAKISDRPVSGKVHLKMSCA